MLKLTKKSFEGNKIIMLIFLLIGVALLSWGLTNIYYQNQTTKDYVSIEGEFVERIIVENTESENTSKLLYRYKVDGIEYQIKTDYTTSIIPSVGSKRTIKYDPTNPSNAIITGFNGNFVSIFIGFMFCIIPLFLTLTMLLNKDSEKEQQMREKLIIIFFGIIILIFGIFIYYILLPGNNVFAFFELFKIVGFWFFIPLLFVIVGIYILMLGIFSKNQKYTILKNEYTDEVEINILNNVSDERLNIFITIITILVLCLFLFNFIKNFINSPNIFPRIWNLIFIIYGIIYLLKYILTLLHLLGCRINFEIMVFFENLGNSLRNFFQVLFYILWFVFLIVIDYFALFKIKTGGISIIIFSLLFWVAGIYSLRKKYKKMMITK